tara:strand:+ start:305 stop:514 length:210 start_codon:yes stop_codon:yes gene_type:complete
MCFFKYKKKYVKIENSQNYEMLDEKILKYMYVENSCFNYEKRVKNMMKRWKINEKDAIDLIYHFEINQS